MIPKGFKLLDHLSPEQKEKYLAAKEQKKIEQANAQKVFRRLNQLTKGIGLKRKSNWFSKQSGHVAHVIHFHKNTFGPSFSMYVLIRVLNDSSGHVALNGMSGKEELELRKKRFDYIDSEESIQACAQSIFDAMQEIAIPWFQSMTLKKLISKESPLTVSGKAGLWEALNGNQNIDYINESKKALGLNV